jgi:hypothetical protein
MASRPPDRTVGPLPGLLRRVVQFRRPRLPDRAPAQDPAAIPSETILADLLDRVEHLEAAIEGLQDSVHRESVRRNRVLADLERKLRPGEIRRALNEDSRRRGL